MLMNRQSAKPIPRFSRETCLACTMCVDICPTGALDLLVMNSKYDFRRYPFLSNHEACIGCMNCRTECPVGAIQAGSRE
jgi:formate hydrogenlyase subunit 6/NADH:ubiquinone oxidoreductase subunit I